MYLLKPHNLLSFNVLSVDVWKFKKQKYFEKNSSVKKMDLLLNF